MGRAQARRRTLLSAMPPGLTVGLIVTVAAAVAALLPQWPGQPLLAAANLLVTATFGVTALLLGAEPGQATNGRLFLGAAVCWTAGYIGYIGDAAGGGPWALAEWLLGPLTFPLLATVLLRYPGPRLERRRERVFVAALAASLVALRLASAVVSRPEWHLFDDGAWWPAVAPSPGAALAVDTAFMLVAAAFSCVFVGLVTRRLRLAEAIDRRLLRPVAAAAVAAGFVVGGEVASRFLTEGSAALSVVFGIEAVAMLAIPAAFLVAAVSRRLAHGAVSGLVVALSGPMTPDQVQDALAEALDDPSLRLIYHRADTDGRVDPDGVPAEPAPPSSGRWTRTVATSDGEPLVTLDMHASLAGHPDLVEAAVSAARLALENSRLQATTRASLQEVRRSRTRIVEAGDTERRRLERDLHDGVQQRLLAIKVALATARAQAQDDRERAVLDGARDELQGTLDDLRTLARGIHPAILTEAGLGPAVRAVAERLPLDVELSMDPGRHAALVEATAYYVCCEALANAVKHADTPVAHIVIRQVEGELMVSVTDRGTGGAVLKDGGGLVGLRDRVGAAGGRLVVGSDGSGTTVSAAIPCD